MGSGPAARDSPTREGIAAPTRAGQPQESCHEPPWLLPRAAGCTSLSLTAAWELPVGVGRGTSGYPNDLHERQRERGVKLLLYAFYDTVRN